MRRMRGSITSVAIVIVLLFAMSACGRPVVNTKVDNDGKREETTAVQGDSSQADDKKADDKADEMSKGESVINTSAFFYSTVSMNVVMNLESNPENENNLFDYNNYVKDADGSAHPSKPLILYKDDEAGSFKLLDLEKMEVVAYPHLDAASVFDFSISPSGKYVLVRDTSSMASVYEFESGKKVKDLNTTTSIYAIAWSPTLDILAGYVAYGGDATVYQICTYSSDNGFNENVVHEYKGESSPRSFEFKYWVDNDKFMANIQVEGSSDDIDKYCWIFDVTTNGIEKLQGYYPKNDSDYSYAADGPDEYSKRVLQLHGISDIDFSHDSNPTTLTLKDVCMDLDVSPIYFDKNKKIIVFPGYDGLQYRTDTKRFSYIGSSIRSIQNCQWFYTEDWLDFKDDLK